MFIRNLVNRELYFSQIAGIQITKCTKPLTEASTLFFMSLSSDDGFLFIAERHQCKQLHYSAKLLALPGGISVKGTLDDIRCFLDSVKIQPSKSSIVEGEVVVALRFTDETSEMHNVASSTLLRHIFVQVESDLFDSSPHQAVIQSDRAVTLTFSSDIFVEWDWITFDEV